MSWLAVVWHVLGFAAPAVVVGLALAVTGAVGGAARRPAARVLLRQAAINAAAGMGALLVGLAMTAHDGKMLSYLAMVGAVALVQALRMGRA